MVQVKNKPVLHLNLKRKWFDMIASGEKKEEYREVTCYWGSYFVNGHIKVKGTCYHPSDVLIMFSNGYSKKRPQMLVKCNNLIVRRGKAKWGASINEVYYVLLLGDILKTFNYSN